MLALRCHDTNRPHIVQPISQLNQHDTRVIGHRNKHLAIAARLGIFLGLVLKPGELGHPIDK